MVKRYASSVLLVGFALALVAPSILMAQGIRPEKTFFFKPRVGVAWHLGDTERSPFDFGDMDQWKVDGKLPLGGGLEIGYQFNQSTSFSLGWRSSMHPLIFHYGTQTSGSVPQGSPNYTGEDISKDGTWYNGAEALFRFAGTGRIAPVFAIGAHVLKGNDDRSKLAYGPSAGLGLDIVVSDRISLVLENIADFTFPDDAVDNAKTTGDAINNDRTAAAPQSPRGSWAPFDVLNTLTLGLKYNFKSAFTPVVISGIQCPTGPVTAGQAASFSATTNDLKATQPVEYRWEFGDANTGTGMMTSHTFGQAGTYTVTFTATNARSTDTETCSVTVVPPPPAISSLTANPSTFEVCQPTTVNFSANIGGGPADSYSWNFGDGSTGTGANPTHTYSTAGTYTVTLTVTNVSGTDTRTMTVTAQPCTSMCRDITELNAVYFDRNGSTLTTEGRAALQENLDILKECPTICVRIEGWAAPGERNGQRLSEDRARAVEQFYIDNGVAGSRLMTVGMGVVKGQTTKKEGGSQLRRVDSIPMACDLMGSH